MIGFFDGIIFSFSRQKRERNECDEEIADEGYFYSGFKRILCSYFLGMKIISIT